MGARHVRLSTGHAIDRRNSGWRFDGLLGRNAMIVEFRPAALHPGIFLKLALRGFESVTQGDIAVFMGLLVVMIAADHDLLLRNAQINPDFVEITLMLVVMFCLDGNPATDDMVVELLQFGCFLTDLGGNCIGMRNTPKRNL